MRACATGSAVFFGLLLSAAVFSACSGGASGPETPPPPDNAAPPPPVASGAADMPNENPVPTTTAKKEPATMDDCKQITGNSLVNEPPANGTVMNNAMTSGDAGASDRLAPLIDVVKARRDGFRCCFDIWSKNNPGQSGRILMTWSLKADGAVDKITVDAAKSTLHAPDVEACMVNIAQGMTYPPSPQKKLTTFNYPFEFRAKK